MKTGLIIGALLLLANVSFADQYVQSYTRSNGTYVNGYTRSSANNTVTDNYSFKGNTNPHTGESGSNYYRNDSSSPYYNGGSGSTGNGASQGSSNGFNGYNQFD